jgi:DNA-directed RNA polymerase specialized sigma24 family protein
MRVRRLPSDHELEEAVDPSRRGARTQAIRREMDELLGRTLERLSPADRELLDLLYRAGLSRKEVAERLDVPLEVIHRRCDRAHGRVRASLSQHFTTLVARREERGAVTLEEIRALRPGFRQAVIARHFEDGSERDAAARLGLPEATFRARLQSAYEILKRDPTADFSSAKAAWRKERGL